MKYFSVILVLLIGSIINLQAQTFQCDKKLVDEEIQSDAYAFPEVNISNVSQDTLLLAWTTLYNDMPALWDVSICDYGNCYFSIPTGGMMDTMSGKDKAFMKINVNPMGGLEIATLKFYVYDVNFPNDGDTLTFIMRSKAPTAINEINTSSIAVYPNPTTEQVVITNPAAQLQTLSILNLQGQLLYTQNLLPFTNQQVQVAHWPQGVYLLQLKDEAGNLAQQRLLKQ